MKTNTKEKIYNMRKRQRDRGRGIDLQFVRQRGEEKKLSDYCWVLQVLKEHGYDPILIGNDAELLEKYIRKITPVTPTLDNRLVIIE